MKKTSSIFCACLAAALSLAADGVIRRLVWQNETSDPVPRNWSIWYGETFDMEVRYLDHTRPMNVSNSVITLHVRTNGMAEGWSFQTTGSVGAAVGWATVRVNVDALIPQGISNATYTVQATESGTTNLLTATGTFRLSGSGSGIYSAALPASSVGWLLYDWGVRDWLRVSVSNRCVTADPYVWRGEPIPYPAITNGLATQAEVAAATNGLVGAGVTNGLASTAYVGATVAAATNGLVRASVTNGLATVAYVGAAVASATNGLAGVGVTNGLATVAYVGAAVAAATNGLVGASVTNGFVSTAYVGAAVASATNGLVGASVTNGLASTAYVGASVAAATNGLAGASVTNGMATTAYVGAAVAAATNGLVGASVTNGLASTAYVGASVAAATNGLVGAGVTNGLATAAYVGAAVTAATNGLVGASVTNGLATVGYVGSAVSAATNGLVRASVTNGLVSAAALTAATNGLVGAGVTNGLATTGYVIAATNGLVRASVTNGLATTGYVIAATTGVLRAEADTLATVAARGDFAGTETISPLIVNAKRYGNNAGYGAGGNNWLAIGSYAGYTASANDWLALGYYAGYAHTAARSVMVGPWAGRNATGTGRVYIAAWTNDPGAAHDPQYDNIYIDAAAGATWIGQTNGTLYLRGYVPVTNGLVGASVTNGLAASAWVTAQIAAATNGIAGADASITNGLASVDYVMYLDGLATNGLASITYAGNLVADSTNGLVRASVTNGLAATSYVIAATSGLASASWVTAQITAATNGLGSADASITNGLASIAYVDAQVFAAGTVTPDAVTNNTSHLLAWYTNSTGFVTQQIWRVGGGGIVTNFFSRAGATGTYTEDGWTRPADWPVATGYTVEQWRAAESNVCKLVLLADEWEGFVVDVAAGGRYWVDWNGDGTADQNYADAALASNVYAGADIGALKAVRIGTWGGTNIVSVEFSNDADSKIPASNSLIAGAKRYGLVELVVPAEQSSLTEYACYAMRELKSVSIKNATSIATYALYASSIDHLSAPSVTALADYGLNYTRTLKYINITNLVTVGQQAFSYAEALRVLNAPKINAIGTQGFLYGYALTSVSAMTSWTNTVGNGCFQNCNLSYETITNLALNLPARGAMATINMTVNPGSAAALIWYKSGSVSNDLAALNWRLSL